MNFKFQTFPFHKKQRSAVFEFFIPYVLSAVIVLISTLRNGGIASITQSFSCLLEKAPDKMHPSFTLPLPPRPALPLRRHRLQKILSQHENPRQRPHLLLCQRLQLLDRYNRTFCLSYYHRNSLLYLSSH